MLLILTLLRHLPLVAALLVLCVLELSSTQSMISRPYFTVPTYMGMSLFIVIAIIIWLMVNGRRPQTTEETEE